jgi:hypothetical protein
MLIVNEEYAHFTTVQQKDVYFFFEVSLKLNYSKFNFFISQILDFANNQQNMKDLSNTFPIAWAFLKVNLIKQSLSIFLNLIN